MEKITLYYDEKKENVIGCSSLEVVLPNTKITTKEDPDYLLFAQKRQIELDEQLKRGAILQMRTKRNDLLKESDWIFLTDVTLKNKEAWLTYRQALRDLPQNFSEPSEVVWPEKPE